MYDEAWQKGLQKRRTRAARLLERGVMPAEVARRIGVTPTAVGRWRRALDAGGRSALQAKALGRRCTLSEAQWAEVDRLIEGGAVAAGYPNEVWTLPRIACEIERRFGVVHTGSWLSRKLRARGFSAQRPAGRARQRDEGAIEAWVRAWPTAKKPRRDTVG